jgi:chromosome segregation ATPase
MPMFSIERLEVVHWDWWERFTIPLDANIVTIVGPNGSGKTTLLDALRTVLAIDCSAGRDYKRYVRRADRPYAWLRLVADNTRNSQGQLAFWPLTSPKVTLFCRIRKKGGDWERNYGIGAGDVPVEQAEQDGAVTWIGVRQYAAQLDGAGLTRAIKRVLALDQGHTDKLCEYSGRQLLDLVFDVFGDREVLDNYDAARDDQNAVARELDELKVQLAHLHTKLQAAESDVNSYNDYNRLNDELGDLVGQWQPRSKLVELADSLRGGRAQLLGKRRERRDAAAQLQEQRTRLATLTQELEQARTQEEQAKGDYERLQSEEKPILRALGAAAATLAQREALLARIATQTPDFDVERLRRRQFEIEQRIGELDNERAELDARMSSMDAGRRPMPPEVASFRAELDRAGIRHVGLSEIVEITDERWQNAVEAVLAGVRHLILLEDPQDRAAAWRLGERLRYRHYVVPDRADVDHVRSGSLLECINFTAPPPVWLSRLLNDIQCVESVEHGAKLPDSQSWITPSAYQRERRGARDISVKDSYFGAQAGAQARRKLGELQDEVDALYAQRASLSKRISELQSRLAGIDAAQELSAREPEFEAAQAEHDRLSGQAATLTANRENAAHQYYTLSQTRTPLERDQARAEEGLELSEQRDRQLFGDLDAARRSHVDTVLRWRALRASSPLAWYQRAGLAECRERYDSPKMVEHEIERLEQRKQSSRFVTDAQCLMVRDKLQLDHRQLEDRIEQQDAHLERARQSTDRARAQYLSVLRTTIRLYARNLEKLGALAGIQVEVRFPNLSNDDLSLTHAALEVQFDFDQKGMIGLNDGEASGGQQVMKSMILLVGLLMEDDQTQGGFVFIDEPFAHLDVFNIDKVGAFLQATRAQYIVTTPNTHNVNVFQPSELTLLTQKRKSSSKFAPPVAFLRRGRDEVAATTAAV